MTNTDKVLTYGTEVNKSIPDIPWWKFWKRRRYVVSLMALLGFFNVYALRANLSIAIVAMTENKTITLENGTITYKQEFDWDSKTQGYILSSFFYGYITTQLLGGWISSKIGGKKVFGFGIASTALLTLITPWCANTNVYLLLAVRIVEGICEGVSYPCIHAVWARWAPPLERTRLATLSFSGSYIGTVVAMPVCAILADHFGWPSIFYVFGSVAILWVILWMVMIAETPAEDKYISEAELEYITEALDGTNVGNVGKQPWMAMMTSLPVWAIFVSHFCEVWGFYTLLTQLPKFMKDVLNFDLGKTGYMSALPYLAMFILIQVSGFLADWCQTSGLLTTTQVRRYFNCGGFIAQTVFLLAAALLLSPIGTTLCLTLAVGLGGFAWSGFSVNYLDVAPQYASVLMGIGNTIGTLPGIISPIISGYIVTTPTKEEWQIVFFIASGIYLFGCVFYWFFVSGELQEWAKQPQENEDDTRMEVRNGKENPAFKNDA